MKKKQQNAVTELPTELESIADWVRWAITQFESAQLHYGHGADNALDEAYYLVTQVLQLPYDIPPYMMRAVLTDSEKRDIYGLIQRRIQERVPLPYLTHKAWFAGLEFYVDQRVLIPRSPMAELIEAGFQPWIRGEGLFSVLDLCTGSACIAVACALAFPEAEVVASDIDDEVLQVAEINIKAHELDHRITLCQSDVFDGLDPDEQFDLIISNPPYVDDEDMQALPPEYRHEPGLALAAGENGLQVVEKIINGAHARLKDNGMLIVEVGNSADALLDAYPNLEFTWFEFEHGATPVFLLYKEQLQLDAHNDAGSKVVH